MKMVIKAALVLMTILTVIYLAAVVYAAINVDHSRGSNNSGKHPIDYGIWIYYFVEKLDWEPHEWNTTEELGIIFGRRVETSGPETYEILIVDEEKALPWMNGSAPMPNAVNHEENFYHISGLCLIPGPFESFYEWRIPIGAMLGTCWILTGVLLYRWREKE